MTSKSQQKRFAAQRKTERIEPALASLNAAVRAACMRMLKGTGSDKDEELRPLMERVLLAESRKEYGSQIRTCPVCFKEIKTTKAGRYPTHRAIVAARVTGTETCAASGRFVLNNGVVL